MVKNLHQIKSGFRTLGKWNAHSLIFQSRQRLIYSIVLLFTGWTIALAQQDPMYTHYMYNTLGVNPAYAGSREVLTATLLHRSQWVDFKGSPVTQTISLHAPVFGDAFSLGGSLVNDKIGIVRNTSAYLDIAYRFRLSANSKLAFGLKFGGTSLSADLTSLKLDYGGNTPDNAFAEDLSGKITPNIGFGVYYSRDRFYMGLSTPRLIQNGYKGGADSVLYNEKRHYFFIIGSAINLAKDFDFVPTAFVKITEAAPIEADFSACFRYKNSFEIGAMYRTLDAVGLLAGIGITNNLYLGYSFDWSFENNTAKYNKGSHEIILRYDFFYGGKGRVYSPRYF